MTPRHWGGNNKEIVIYHILMFYHVYSIFLMFYHVYSIFLRELRERVGDFICQTRENRNLIKELEKVNDIHVDKQLLTNNRQENV